MVRQTDHLSDCQQAFFRHAWNTDTKALEPITDASERTDLHRRFPSLAWIHEQDAEPLKCCEMFSGCGGSSLGLEMSGATASYW